jgi:hypothetical protein
MENGQKALFDACMKQVDYFACRWDRRRTDELKVTVAIWTFEIGGIYFVKRPELVPKWAVAVIVLGYAYFWLKKIWDANSVEIDHMIFWQREADSVMRNPSHSVGTAPTFERRPFYNLAFLKSGSMQFQLLSVIVLAFLFYIVPRPS